LLPIGQAYFRESANRTPYPREPGDELDTIPEPAFFRLAYKRGAYITPTISTTQSGLEIDRANHMNFQGIWSG
jgi:hypothetical protein